LKYSKFKKHTCRKKETDNLKLNSNNFSPLPLTNPYLSYEQNTKQISKRGHLGILKKHFLSNQVSVSFSSLHFHFLKKLSCGSYGQVSLVKSLISGKEYAIKKIKKRMCNSTDMKNVWNEVECILFTLCFMRFSL